MKTIDELKAFCEGYIEALIAAKADLYDWDDWVLWGGYDIQFNGPYYDELAPDDERSLVCDVYKAGWEGNLPPTLHRFVVTSTNQGESK
jgi:hypothetical protein